MKQACSSLVQRTNNTAKESPWVSSPTPRNDWIVATALAVCMTDKHNCKIGHAEGPKIESCARARTARVL